MMSSKIGLYLSAYYTPVMYLVNNITIPHYFTRAISGTTFNFIVYTQVFILPLYDYYNRKELYI